MNFKDAQQDMRQSYFGGASGVIVSGVVWLIAGIAALVTTERISVMSLFLGGMLIHPLAIVISKALKRSGKPKKENPLSALSLESTFLLFFGLFIAFAVFQIRPNWFYPILLLIIGGRYLIFSSIYGMRIYWILGMILALSGIVSIYLDLTFCKGAFIGGITEVVFACIVFYLENSRKELIEN
jgi:hypothetical protein